MLLVEHMLWVRLVSALTCFSASPPEKQVRALTNLRALTKLQVRALTCFCASPPPCRLYGFRLIGLVSG